MEQPDELQEVKRRARATWAAGDYDVAADGIWSVGGIVTRAARIGAGDRVLDVACGTGNAAVQAAQAGGKVTGVDLTPEMFPAARRRAFEAGVDVELIEGDAEELPFDDCSFDVVLSTFGVMFAPRHVVAASEIVRVLKDGGRVGLANWHPEGSVGGFFRALAHHLPPPPPVAQSPLLWGSEDYVRELFDGRLDLDFTREHVDLAPGADRGDKATEFLGVFPPLVAARSLLEVQGAWEAVEADIRPVLEAMYANPPTYLVVTGTKDV